MDPYIQLTIGIFIAAAAFVAAYILPTRTVAPAVLVVAPFEIIQSRFGSSSTGLVIVVTIALFMRRSLNRFPMLWAVILIGFAYALSLSVAEVRKLDHVIYLVRILPGFFIFYIAYNFVMNGREVHRYVNVLLIINLLVLFVCVVQLVGGSRQIMLFGIQEFSLMANRETGRLSGPFGAEFTSEYYALATLLIMYLIVKNRQGIRWPAIMLWAIAALNLGFMVMTGSRGGILVLIIGFVAGLILFRREINMGRMFMLLVGFVLVALITIPIVIKYSEYNVLLIRLQKTDVSEGIIDTRSQTWPTAWKEIIKKPVLGYGPRLRLQDDLEQPIPGHHPIPYPHSLPLFILYTLGVVGLFAYSIFFAALFYRMYKGSSATSSELSGLAMLGVLLLVVFLLDEIKIEFLRIIQTSYQMIVFTIFGGFAAIADLARKDPGLTIGKMPASRRVLVNFGQRRGLLVNDRASNARDA